MFSNLKKSQGIEISGYNFYLHCYYCCCYCYHLKHLLCSPSGVFQARLKRAFQKPPSLPLLAQYTQNAVLLMFLPSLIMRADSSIILCMFCTLVHVSL